MQRASLHIKSNKTAAIKLLIAAAFALSCVLVACEKKTQTTKSVDLNKAPRQVVDSIYAVQTENGGLTMRVERPTAWKALHAPTPPACGARGCCWMCTAAHAPKLSRWRPRQC